MLRPIFAVERLGPVTLSEETGLLQVIIMPYVSEQRGRSPKGTDFIIYDNANADAFYIILFDVWTDYFQRLLEIILIIYFLWTTTACTVGYYALEHCTFVLLSHLSQQ